LCETAGYFVTIAANINDSEFYGDKGDCNQKSVCRVYVATNVVRNKRDEKKRLFVCRL